jgi:hypothetical protein
MTDHVVMLRNTSTIKCLHCGMEYPIHLPCPSSLFTAILDKFIETHIDCEKPND